MKLQEMLKICLLSLASRYPESVVEVNEGVLDYRGLEAEVICTPLRLLELLQINAPHLLQATARIVIDERESAIYLVERSEETYAFWIHREGNLPAQPGKQMHKASH